LSLKQRKACISAVLCLTRKPSKASRATNAKWPGVRTRLDDFAAAHMDQVFFIHVTVRTPLSFSFFLGGTQLEKTCLSLLFVRKLNQIRGTFLVGIETLCGYMKRL
jgi:hypothetical protein